MLRGNKRLVVLLRTGEDGPTGEKGARRVTMKGLLCILLGHDILQTSASHRVCLRCGQRGKRRNLGHVVAWVESSVGAATVGASGER